jgi:hypothetical protein
MSGSSNALLDSLAHPAQINLLADYGGAAQTANAIWENRAWQAKQAAGQNFLNSINPDGTPNQNALLQGAKNTPGMALVAQPSAQAGQTLSADTQNQNLQLRATVNQMLPSLLNLPPDKLHAGVVNGFTQLENAGLMTHQRSLQIMSGFSNDPAQLQVQLGQLQKSLLPAQEQIDQTYGTRPAVNTGGATVFPVVPPASAGGAGPVVPMTMTPGEASTPTPIGVTPQGQTVTGTRGQFVGAATGSAPSPLGSGRPPPGSPLLNPAAPAAGTSPSPAGAASGGTAPAIGTGAPGGGIVTGLGPAQTAALDVKGKQSAADFQGYAADGDRAVQQNAILGNMLADTKGFTTGPANARIKAFQSFASTYAPKMSAFVGVDPKTVAANESFDKLAAQLANAQGAGSDARLMVNQAANPHGEMAPASVDLVLRQLQGNADYKIAKQTLANAYPDKTDSTGFETAMQRNLDPRAFQFARMTVPQRKTYVAALSPQDLTAVKGGYNWAVTHGMIGAGNAAQ